MKNIKFVNCKDIKPRVVYYLTDDFYPDGGKPVKLRRFFQAKDIFSNTRGKAAEMVTEDGKSFAIHPKGVVFSSY